MKRATGVLLVVVGVVLLGLGLLFLAGAEGQGRRLLIGVAGLALGAVSAGFGVRAFKGAEAESPAAIEAAILDLARRRNGEVTMTDVRAALGRRHALATGVIERLVGAGDCRRVTKGGEEHLIFPDLQPRLMTRLCEYCDTEIAVNAEAEKCPNCGGVLETRVAVRSAGEGTLFSMDE